MAQFVRPDGNITQTGFTGGFEEIDEAAASSSDLAWGANNTAAVLEVSLSNPAAAPGAGTTTFRYQIVKTKDGVIGSAGNAVTVTAEFVQGTTVLATDAVRTATGAATSYAFTPDTAGVTDWNDLRLRFTTSASGGSPANRRGGAVTWAELEVPDAAGSGPIAIGVATSLASALPLSGRETGQIGVASTAPNALVQSGRASGGVSAASGMSSALALTGRVFGQFGAAPTVAQALPLSQGGTAQPIGVAISLASALPLSGREIGETGVAATAPWAMVQLGQQRGAVGAAQEASSALALTGRESGQIAVAQSSAAALAQVQGGVVQGIAPAGALSAAVTFEGRLSGGIGAAGSAAGALALTGRESGQIGTGLTSSLALPQSQGSAGQPLPSRVRPIRGRQVVRPVAARPNTVRAVGARRTVVAVRA